MDDSGAFYRRIVESSDDGVWAFDLTGRTLYASARVATLLGRDPDELTAMSVQDVLAPGERAAFHEHLARLADVDRADGPGSEPAGRTYRRADGTSVELVVREHPLRDEAGRVLGAVHRLSDDPSPELLRQLRRGREQLDEGQALARLGSWELDLRTGEIVWSRGMFLLLGLDPETDQPSDELFVSRVVSADQAQVNEAVLQVFAGQSRDPFDFRVSRDDEVAWMRGHARVMYAEDGEPVRMGGTIQDITDIKEAELQLLDSVILNAMMQVMAAAANESTTLAEALEISRDQLLAHDDWGRAVAFEVVPGDVGPSLRPYLATQERPESRPNDHELQVAWQVLATDDVVFEEHALPQTPSIGFPLRLYGAPIVVLVITACSPFERHAMLRSMVDQVADQLERVVERELAATELAAARDAAMEASRLKSEFLAMMSHEIRTPMNGVIGLNEVLLRTDLDEKQRRLARGVQVAGQSLLGLINDLLDFSKIEAGELELEVVDFDVATVFEQAAQILSAPASDKQLEITVDVAPDVPPRLVGDPVRFGQILSNLMSNAVKFTAEGSVRVRARVAARHGDEVTLRVEVRDTGIGIAPEVQNRLFEPFRQADASTTRTFGGTGLGLAIAKQLVGAFGGEIGLDSVPGTGSTFWFTARFRTAESTHRAPRRDWASPSPQAPARRGHVLVVEDNDINQLVALGLLETIGYTADLAANGEDAVAMAVREEYDAVLMDLQMPGMDGYAASRLIRSQEPAQRRVPIIAMTASAIDGERERCLAAGMDDFLTKPVDTGRLEAVLRAHSPGVHRNGAAHPQLEEATMTPTPAVDLSRVEELLSLGESAVALVDRAIGNFVRNLPQHLEDLHDAVMSGDAVRLRDLAHRLRGSALNLGATRVAEATWVLESHGDADTPHLAGPALLELREAAAEAVVVLDDYRCGRVAS